MTDQPSHCRWRLMCWHRADEQAERAALLDLAPRIASVHGPCGVCGLQVVTFKGNTRLTHIVPVEPAATRPERALAAAGHTPSVEEVTMRRTLGLR